MSVIEKGKSIADSEKCQVVGVRGRKVKKP